MVMMWLIIQVYQKTGNIFYTASVFKKDYKLVLLNTASVFKKDYKLVLLNNE
jgi:hypothetical protein